ncbi:MAG: hypothetical protein C5B59_02150 [Bacteroidetes bacterium]|nr:MAG: hypothetical protein C5B59_02150 [Bacteroidota bacterium]
MKQIFAFMPTFLLSVIFCNAQKLTATDVNSPEVTVVVDIKVNPQFKSEVKSLVPELSALTIKEAGALSYNYYLSPDGNKILIIEQYKSLSAFQEHGKNLFSGPLGQKFRSSFTVNSIVVAGGNLPDSVGNFTVMKSIGGFNSKCE